MQAFAPAFVTIDQIFAIAGLDRTRPGMTS
jgi:hypothetical protein